MIGITSTVGAYDAELAEPGHTLRDLHVAGLAGATVLGVLLHAHRPLLAMLLGLLVAFGAARRVPATTVGLCIALSIVGAIRSDAAWADAVPRHVGAFAGWARVVGDPMRSGAATRITLQIEDERFDAWVYGSSRRRLEDRQPGEWVLVDGERRPLGANPERAQVRHVVGRFAVEFVADVRAGGALDRASATVRRALRRAAEASMTADESALFAGLVIGDDSRQPDAMVQQFRDAGLSHLTAVSGQNVVFVLAAAGPLLRRLRPWLRWAVTLALIGWFMALTRFEPSVLRAGFMAMLAATSFVVGLSASAVRLLAVAVTTLVLIDPLLVWSVGFWLSVGATWGVAAVGPKIAALLPGPQWLRVPLGVTLGAQLGVALPSLLVFGRLPLVSIPANLLAVPVAGFVMLVGIPAALLAAMVPVVGPVVMWLPTIATRWVAIVAQLGARIEPPPRWSLAGWAIVMIVVATMAHRRRRHSRVPS